MKKLLCIINYYYPYVSGVSEYARLACEELAKKGWEVTVLASNHDKLSKNEVINGVKIIRAPIICKISKGTVSTEFIRLSRKLAKQADAIYMHLPMMEAGIIASLINTNKLVVTYQCDINLPSSLINKIIVKFMNISHHRCLKKCKKIGVTSMDYALHSSEISEFSNKVVELGAPIKEYFPCEKTYRDQNDTGIIGFCGRIVAEKGIEVLLKAFALIQREYPTVKLLVGGDYENVAGGSIYDELKKFIEEKRLTNVHFLGKLPEEKMAQFYSSLDVFVLPSNNKLEAFGMVQVEAMMCGTPVVASSLYGVRTIVQKTGMGEVFIKDDYKDLAKKIISVMNNRDKYVKNRETIVEMYGIKKFADDCENVLQSI